MPIPGHSCGTRRLARQRRRPRRRCTHPDRCHPRGRGRRCSRPGSDHRPRIPIGRFNRVRYLTEIPWACPDQSTCEAAPFWRSSSRRHTARTSPASRPLPRRVTRELVDVAGWRTFRQVSLVHGRATRRSALGLRAEGAARVPADQLIVDGRREQGRQIREDDLRRRVGQPEPRATTPESWTGAPDGTAGRRAVSTRAGGSGPLRLPRCSGRSSAPQPGLAAGLDGHLPRIGVDVRVVKLVGRHCVRKRVGVDFLRAFFSAAAGPGCGSRRRTASTRPRPVASSRWPFSSLPPG